MEWDVKEGQNQKEGRTDDEGEGSERGEPKQEVEVLTEARTEKGDKCVLMVAEIGGIVAVVIDNEECVDKKSATAGCYDGVRGDDGGE